MSAEARILLKGRLLGALFLGLLLVGGPLAGKKKMTPADLIALHVDSIGPAEVRAKTETRLFQGQGIWRVLAGGQGQLLGTVFTASDGPKWTFRFDTQGNPSYYGEHLSFDGNEVRAMQAFQNGHSHFGQFFKTNSLILREGLLGGATSTAWPLLDLESHNPKLKYAGLKKVEGGKLHRLDYRPRKRGGELRIQLFFEPETYRHVRTEYRYQVPQSLAGSPPTAQLGDPTVQSARQQPSFVTVTETFWNFRQIDGLTIPANWKIHYNRTSQSQSGPGSVVSEWEVAFKTAVHNQKIDAAYYKPGATIE